MNHDAASPDAKRIVDLLRERDGAETIVRLSDGRRYQVFNIAWGQDLDDPEFHITSNISPDVAGSSIDVFRTDEVLELSEPRSGEVLFARRLTSA